MQIAAARASVSVPGKVILMGEHAAVYGRAAVIAAVGMRLRAALEVTGQDEVVFELAGIGLRRALAWDEIRALTAAARDAWQRYDREPTPASFAALRGGGTGDLVALALGETALAMAGESLPAWPGLHVKIDSELPVGAGFGSSAAAALAVATAAVALFRGTPDWPLIHGTVLEVERRQHGAPSGVDAVTVFHGGVLRAVRREGGLDAEPLAVNPAQLAAIRVYTSGAPPDRTGEVVAVVRQRRDADIDRFEHCLTRMHDHTEAFARALRHAGATAAELIEPIRGYHRCLCEIGVVPEPVQRLIEAIEASGGAAKISGAGSVIGPAAGSLLAVHPDPAALQRTLAGADLIEYPVALGVEGVRVERVEPAA